MDYNEGIEWLFSLHRFGMKLGLENIQALTEALGRPQDRFESVLVAGTNGKGSTAAMLHAILVSAGVHSGLYTSPHLVRTEERIRIGDAEISPQELASLLGEVRDCIDALRESGRIAAHPTFFEVITAAGLMAFARAGVEVAILEVGLGGRLDATNVVSPVLSIITGIDLDHQEQLGTTLGSIAREKAGILRAGVTVLLGEIDGEALEAIREEAAIVGSPLVLAQDGCTFTAADVAAREVQTTVSRPAPAYETHEQGGKPGASLPSGVNSSAEPGSSIPSDQVFSIVTPVRSYTRISCPLQGAHQLANARLAIRAAELLAAHFGGPARQRGPAAERERGPAAPHPQGPGAEPRAAHPGVQAATHPEGPTAEPFPAPLGPLAAHPEGPAAEQLPAHLEGPAAEHPHIGAETIVRGIGAKAIARGIGAVRWPGRLEWVDGSPRLLLDGAHNAAACRALAAYLESLSVRPVLLFAAMRDKEIGPMLASLLPRVSAAVFTMPPLARAVDPGELLDRAREFRVSIARSSFAPSGMSGTANGLLSAAPLREELSSLHNPAETSQVEAHVQPGLSIDEDEGLFAQGDVSSALTLARRLAGAQGTVLVSGSLFLVGAVKEVLEGLPVRAGARS